LNSSEGYEEIIALNDTFITKRLDDIKKLNEYESKGIQLYNRPNLEALNYDLDDILHYKYENLITRYSLGGNVEDLIQEYGAILPYMDKRWKKEGGYVDMIWMLSIGIMLEVNDGQFAKLAEIVRRDNPDDYLIDFLINYRIPSWEIKSDSFMSKLPYQSTKEIISISKMDKRQGLERLKKYLSKEWYRGHSSAGWHDSHKSKWNIHSGYWSFESGALVKILGLNDSSLKGVQYYPYDMVHWND
jgi:hypothetical protein